MKVGIGADHNAFQYKEEVRIYLKELGYEVKDYGCYSKEAVDYPEIAFTVCNGVLAKEVERGILFCGTGIGMAIAANKVPGIRAAQVVDPYSAERAQLSNDAQVITIGAKVMGIEVVKKVIVEYLAHQFQGGNSAQKIRQIMDQEKKSMK